MIPISSRVTFLRGILLFHDLGEEELTQLATKVREKSYEMGKEILAESDERDCFFMVYSGNVNVSIKFNDQKVHLLSLVSGDYFGEEAIFTYRKSHEAIKASTNGTTILLLSRSDVTNLCRQHRHLLSNFNVSVISRKLTRNLNLNWLRNDEVIYFITRKHPLKLRKALLLPIATLVLPLTLFAIALYLGMNSDHNIGDVLTVISTIIVIGIIGWAAWRMIDWGNEYFIVTNQRVVSLEKNITVYDSRQDVTLSAILAVDFEMDFIGQMWDYGNIIVRTSISKIIFNHVPSPAHVVHVIKEHWYRSLKNISKQEDEASQNFQRRYFGGYMDSFELLKGLRKQLLELPYQDSARLDALRRRTEMIIRNLFGQSSKYLDDLKRISFHPMVIPSSENLDMLSWKSGREELENLLNTMEEELRLFQPLSKQDHTVALKQPGNRIFIVHGHDEEMKQHVARIITRLEIEPVILHEKPNQGRTIIEKFTDYSDVSFAVVLLSPDDIARQRTDAPEAVKSRARQNVVLELGYFLGKLGRNRVVAIYREEPNFEMPSDYSGVLFVPFDSAGKWQFDLARELKASGFNIDANKLI